MKSNPLMWLVLGGLVLAGVYWAVTQAPMATTPAEVTTETVLKESPTTTSAYPAVVLQTQNNLGQSGTATFTKSDDGKLIVTLALSGGDFTDPQPAHIHVGSCPNPGAVKYPLTSVVDGFSQTTLPVSWDDLVKAGEKLAINVHKSAKESTFYTACGDMTLAPVTETKTETKTINY